jgi:serine/threonine protein kinase
VQIARGLAAAHARGIVHRDLKPENIFITNDAIVKILDFGLAKLMPGANNEEMTRTIQTSAGVIMGTAGYMSPEQLRGGSVDTRSDLFSFGAVLYEMLSGSRAFPGKTAAECASAILKEDVTDVNGRRVRSAATNINRLHRYPTAGGFGRSLRLPRYWCSQSPAG